MGQPQSPLHWDAIWMTPVSESMFPYTLRVGQPTKEKMIKLMKYKKPKTTL